MKKSSSRGWLKATTKAGPAKAGLPGSGSPTIAGFSRAELLRYLYRGCGVWPAAARPRLQRLLPSGDGAQIIEQLLRENARLRRELELLKINGLPQQPRPDKEGPSAPRPLQQIEETLKSLSPQALEERPELMESLHVVERSLERIWRQMEPQVTEKELRRLVVETMRLSLELWQQSTRTSKAELARRSGQWSVYVNQDGWERTQGLDRYLDIVSLPENPRLKKVLSTGDYVIENCSVLGPTRDRLEQTLDRLRTLHASLNQG